MGGKEGAPSQPSPPSTVVCCMCGDQGLVEELFGCKICLVRSQHKYCSDLYPRAGTYRACNWCLREEVGKPFALENIEDRSTSISSSSNSSGGGLLIKLHRGAVASRVNPKPIKKQRLTERSPSDVIGRMRSVDLSPGLGRARQAFRGKARRYKLLEEVSS